MKINNKVTPLALYMFAVLVAAKPVLANSFASQDYTNMSVSEAQLEQCSQKEKPEYDDVRKLIQAKQYHRALEALGTPEEGSPAEENYLYGRLQYLLAYQSVNNRTAVEPEQDKLAKAKQYINTAAKQGSMEAVYDQALLLTAPSNTRQKFKLLKTAADGKFVPAMLTLAQEYFQATKTFEERLEAQSLVQGAAAISGEAKIALASYYLHEDNQFNSLTGYDKNIGKAIELLHAAASQCNASAAYKLFQMSMTEHKPNDLPAERAIYWLEVSAKLGLAKAQGALAEYYYKDVQDGEKAAYWATSAAEQGDLKALLTLGGIYYQGAGADKDFSKALKYYEQALVVDTRNRLVLNQLGIMYYKGEGSEVDFRKAASLCEQAASEGQAGCQYYLGLMYVNGEGVTQDIDTGISWMKKSAAQDFPVAKNWLRENW